MYLVHVALRPPPGGTLGADLPARLRALARPEEALEHVVNQPDALPYPVLGCYLVARSLVEAERTALALLRRATLLLPALRGWTVVRAQVPLLAPFLELTAVSAEGRDGSGHDRIRPAGIPSEHPGAAEN
ncbi:hypothetical protein [Streptomyces sp. NPDC089919]|uniref:hypothetical protein n=1 Tax=Streptomyces sp. NPDC089919 TaxID=3155188 RepID=UPI003436C8FB